MGVKFPLERADKRGFLLQAVAAVRDTLAAHAEESETISSNARRPTPKANPASSFQRSIGESDLRLRAARALVMEYARVRNGYS